MLTASAFDIIEFMGVDAENGSGSAPADSIVGRDAELAILSRIVDTGGAALVSGDAGVGKTRLINELVTAARAGGVRVLLGHCLHFGGDSLPYLPITEALGRLGRTDPEQLATLRADFPAIDRLLPQQRALGRDVGRPVDLSERTESAELFEALLGSVLALAEHSPVLLVLEDVHWADSSIRDLIGFLFARTVGERVALVVTYRSDDLHRRHPLRPVVLEWGRVPTVVRLVVAPLPDESMRTLVRQRHQAPLSDEAVERILRRAGGNPFFAEQLLVEFDDCDQVPADLADLLLVRLERLSADAKAVVKVAAVAGRRVVHPMLREVTALDDSRLDSAVREAVDGYVLARADADAFAFRHALLSETVYDDLLPGERVRLHASFADAIAHGRIAGTDADLARHARAAVDLPTAYEAGLRAGAEAIRVGAPAEAMLHYEAALELASRVDVEPTQRVRATLAAAFAAEAAGHPYRALNLLRDTLRTLPASTPDAERAEVMLAVVRHALPLEADLDLAPLIRDAVSLVPSEPPTSLRARVLAAQARVAHDLDRYDDGIRLATEARSVALGLRLVEVAADASTTLGRLEQRATDPERAVRLLEESVTEAAASADLTTQLRSLHSLGALRYDRGELVESRAAYTRAVELGVRAGQQWAVYALDSLMMTAQCDYVMGSWDRALALCTPDTPPPPFAAAALRAIAMAVGSGRGDPGVGDVWDELRPWWRHDAMIAVNSGAATIDVLASAGRVDEALRVHDEVVVSVGEVWQNVWFLARVRLHALALGGLAAASAHASAVERKVYLERGAQLHADIGRVVAKGRTRQVTQGPEGLAWIARGEAESARLRWQAGEQVDADELVELWRVTTDAFGYGQPAGGHVFEQARSRARLAAARQGAGDQVGAQHDVDAAREVARELGAAPLLAELRSLGTLPAARRSGRDDDVTLTPREQQVLRLVSDGRSNREIARTLFISDKTVSVHVSNILAKLGASGRTEAAAIANRRGLLA